MAEAQLNFKLESNSSASRLGREALVPLRTQLSAETFSDLTLVISELTSNAVKHGPGIQIGVAIAVDDDGLIRGHVDDGGSGGVAITDADASAGTGLGLLIVDTLARSWGVDPGSSRVWFEIAPLSRREEPGPTP